MMMFRVNFPHYGNEGYVDLQGCRITETKRLERHADEGDGTMV